MAEYSREDKIEAITGISNYDENLLDAIPVLAKELKNGKETLESELLGQVMQGINWTVEVLQQAMDVMNEKEKKLDKEVVNGALTELDRAYKLGEPIEIARALEGKMTDALEMICEVGKQFEGE